MSSILSKIKLCKNKHKQQSNVCSQMAWIAPSKRENNKNKIISKPGVAQQNMKKKQINIPM